jgi:NAD(P)-dependent dehydrogenase (short-subunit alcohol dehydrogenase family)
MAANLWATFLGCKAAIPAMRRRGRGAIVNLSSVNAIEGKPGMLAYAVSKATQTRATDQLPGRALVLPIRARNETRPGCWSHE